MRKNSAVEQRGKVEKSSTVTVVRYGECEKNQAAEIGLHALDGCQEFIASNAPAALTCAACACHRDHHKKIFHSD
ncbi:mini zinc finger [Euphorbia peplus]|nr:mini zinc finger [Euphorbia peplus]